MQKGLLLKNLKKQVTESAVEAGVGKDQVGAHFRYVVFLAFSVWTICAACPLNFSHPLTSRTYADLWHVP